MATNQTHPALAEGHATGSTTLDVVRKQRRRLGLALADLETSIAAPVTDRPEGWWHEVRPVVLDLQTSFANHVAATEGVGALHDEIMWNAPRLAHEVERLQRDHEVIRDRIIEYLDEVDARRPLVDVSARRARYAAMGLLELIAKHRQRGADVVFEAFMVDLGSGE